MSITNIVRLDPTLQRYFIVKFYSALELSSHVNFLGSAITPCGVKFCTKISLLDKVLDGPLCVLIILLEGGGVVIS